MKKPLQNLYKIIMQGFAVEKGKKLLQESVEKLESAAESSKGAEG